MPLNTRVGRCVTKLRNKYGYGKAIGICQYSTKQNYLTGKKMRRKKKGGTLSVKTWLIKGTAANFNKFKQDIFNNTQEYPHADDSEIADIMDYNQSLIDNYENGDITNAVWLTMTWKDAEQGKAWYPGQSDNKANALTNCEGTCYIIENGVIRPRFQRQISHGGKRKTHKNKLKHQYKKKRRRKNKTKKKRKK